MGLRANRRIEKKNTNRRTTTSTWAELLFDSRMARDVVERSSSRIRRIWNAAGRGQPCPEGARERGNQPVPTVRIAPASRKAELTPPKSVTTPHAGGPRNSPRLWAAA